MPPIAVTRQPMRSPTSSSNGYRLESPLSNFLNFIPTSRHCTLDIPNFWRILSRSIPVCQSLRAQVQRHISNERCLSNPAPSLRSSSRYSKRRGDQGNNWSVGLYWDLYW